MQHLASVKLRDACKLCNHRLRHGRTRQHEATPAHRSKPRATPDASGPGARPPAAAPRAVIFIIIAGLVKANPVNAQPFLPFGARGAFNGASIVFFSYIGFDAVACAAGERARACVRARVRACWCPRGCTRSRCVSIFEGLQRCPSMAVTPRTQPPAVPRAASLRA